MSTVRAVTTTSNAPDRGHVAWHDAECGSYATDLTLWEGLAAATEGPILDLGAGTGRVALHLASRGHHVVAVEDDGELLGALDRRAAQRCLPVVPICADVREMALRRRFDLIIAPMQLLHVLGGSDGRARALAAVASHLGAGGSFHAAVLEDELPASGRPDPLPDVREVDGWIHSSLPLEVRVGAADVELLRLRQLVSPAGELTDERATITLDRFSAAQLDRDAHRAGLHIADSEPIGETDEHVGSRVVKMVADA